MVAETINVEFLFKSFELLGKDKKGFPCKTKKPFLYVLFYKILYVG